MQVVVVGSNPSNKSPDKTAFSLQTCSGRTIREWFSDIPGVSFVNVSDEPTPGNRPLLVAEIHANLVSLRTKLECADKIVVVGNTAAYALTLIGLSSPTPIAFLQMPHPSGRNRLFNNKEFRDLQQRRLQEYIQSTNRE